MAKVIMRAQGVDGVMLLLTDRVVIDRPGVWNFLKYGSSGKREIPLAAISEVSFKNATIFTPGAIELVRGGRHSDDKTQKNNANALKFMKRKQPEFEAIKEKIFEMMNQQQQPRR